MSLTIHTEIQNLLNRDSVQLGGPVGKTAVTSIAMFFEKGCLLPLLNQLLMTLPSLFLVISKEL